MRLIRARLAAVALALLAWQITGVAVTPIALCCLNSASAGSDKAVECTCDHTGSATCPMHKTEKKQSAHPQSQPTRWCAGCDQADRMILTMLAVSGGLPESRHRVMRPAATSERMFLVATALPDAARPPASPPPKA